MDWINIEINPGEVLAVLGQKGCGKTTFVELLTGKGTESTFTCKGKVYINHQLMSFSTRKEAKKNGFYQVRGIKNLVPGLSVGENIFLDREYTGALGKIHWNKLYHDCKTLLAQLDITGISSEKIVSDLSVAEQIYVGIAKAVILKMKYLIFDEITKNFNEREIVQLFKILMALKSRGISIIYIPYRVNEIKSICDKYIIISNKSIQGKAEVYNYVEFNKVVEQVNGNNSAGDKDFNVNLERFNITFREQEIIGLIALGYSNQDISKTLSISLGTVKNHIYNIFQKTNVKSRTGLCSLIRL